MDDGENLAALSDKPEPLRPLGDESGRGRVHCFLAESLEVAEATFFGLAGAAASGASGSDFAAVAVAAGFLAGALTGLGLADAVAVTLAGADFAACG